MKKTSLLPFCTVVLVVVTSCTSPSGKERVRRDQARFEQEQRRFPDRLSSQQEAEDAAKARQADLLKQR